MDDSQVNGTYRRTREQPAALFHAREIIFADAIG